MPLSEMKIRNAKLENRPYKLFDGGSLFLMVKPLAERSHDGKPSTGKLWKIKYRYPSVHEACAPQVRRLWKNANNRLRGEWTCGMISA